MTDTTDPTKPVAFRWKFKDASEWGRVDFKPPVQSQYRHFDVEPLYDASLLSEYEKATARANLAESELTQISSHLDCEFDGDAILHAIRETEADLRIHKDRLTALEAEVKRLREDAKWHPISNCPLKEPVDLWCVYGSEEFTKFNGGASIGHLVTGRLKHPEYGFFGNQSSDGVPRRDGPDWVPVAWRKAVPMCPAELIADVLGIPLTLEEATAALEASR